jgi:hypothetical protein
MSALSVPSTASPAEILWTGAAFVAMVAVMIGLGFTLVNLKAASRAYARSCDLNPPEALYIGLTWKDLRNEWLTVAVLLLLLVKLLGYVGLGVLAIETPPPVVPEVAMLDTVGTAVLVVGVVLLATAATLLSVGSAINRRDRHRLVNRITAQLLVEIRARRLAGRSRPGNEQ